MRVLARGDPKQRTNKTGKERSKAGRSRFLKAGVQCELADQEERYHQNDNSGRGGGMAWRNFTSVPDRREQSSGLQTLADTAGHPVGTCEVPDSA